MCGLKFKTVAALKGHVRWKHSTPKTKYTCEICRREFQNPSYLKKHVHTHKRDADSIPSHTCKICNEEVDGNMAAHLKSHAIFRCHKCSLEFVNETELTSHEVQCSKGSTKKVFVCDYCMKEVRGMRRHMVSHLRCHGFFYCQTCTKVFKSRKRLDSHRMSKHAIVLHTCGVCDYKTQHKTVLLNHQRNVHMREKNVPCPQCDAKFFSVSSRNAHMVRHNPVKKYKCSFCEKMFPRSETRRRHERIHTGEKRKVCLICDARFVQKASLSYHMKKYHPEAV